jgi:hypothetical protein
MDFTVPLPTTTNDIPQHLRPKRGDGGENARVRLNTELRVTLNRITAHFKEHAGLRPSVSTIFRLALVELADTLAHQSATKDELQHMLLAVAGRTAVPKDRRAESTERNARLRAHRAGRRLDR